MSELSTKTAISLRRAKKISGWISGPELLWLAQQAQYHSVIIEIGSWKGRSTRALGDYTPGIDGDYAFDSVHSDITQYAPLLKKGGLLCGHDCVRKFAGVRMAVATLLPTWTRPAGSIWAWELPVPGTELQWREKEQEYGTNHRKSKSR